MGSVWQKNFKFSVKVLLTFWALQSVLDEKSKETSQYDWET